jgi:hypothetical protein
MTSVYHICRRARREDIRRSMPLWAQDRVLYDADVWASLPALLEDLMARDLLSFAIVESFPGDVPRLLGGITFVQPGYIDRNRIGPSTLPNSVLRAALQNRHPLLSPKEVGEQNARGELHLLNFFGNMRVIVLCVRSGGVNSPRSRAFAKRRNPRVIANRQISYKLPQWGKAPECPASTARHLSTCSTWNIFATSAGRVYACTALGPQIGT